MKKIAKISVVLAATFMVLGLASCSQEYKSPFVGEQEIVNSYTVKFLNYDKTEVLYQCKVKEHESAIYPLADSTLDREANEYSYYKFTDWVELDSNMKETKNYSLNNITKDTVFAPLYELSDRYYRVTFYSDENGNNVLKEYKGDTAIKAGERVTCNLIPKKTGDVYKEYTFQTWDKIEEMKCVLKDLDVFPVFTSKTKNYTVSFRNYDGSVLHTANQIPAGSVASYPASAPQPTRDSILSEDSEEVFEFIGWSLSKNSTVADATGKLADLTQDLTVYAAFISSKKKTNKKVWSDHIKENGITSMDPNFYFINVNTRSTVDQYFVGYSSDPGDSTFKLMRTFKNNNETCEIEFTFKYLTTAANSGLKNGIGKIKFYKEDEEFSSFDYILEEFSLPSFISNSSTYTFGAPSYNPKVESFGKLTNNEVASYKVLAELYASFNLQLFENNLKEYCKSTNLPNLQ